MFLNSLAAQTSGATTSGGWQMLLPLVLVFGVMYFLIIRPQNKRMREQQNMQSSIKVGDNIVTSGGLIGRVVKLEDKEIHVDFNRAGQPVRVLRTAIVGLMNPSNKAKTMTQNDAGNTKTSDKQTPSSGDNASQKPRVRSPLNRGRAGGNRKSPPKKSEE